MAIVCKNCNREFEIDHETAHQVGVARCVCGAHLNLRGGLPTKMGKYVLQRRIAAGGMGEIYYAKIAGVEGFEREVAIKKMLPHLSADRAFINMMVKEAKLTVLLNHPNIVQVFDLSKEGEEYYIAMEYVPAINVGKLIDYCAQQNIVVPVQLAVHIIMQTLKGLGYAHALRGNDGQLMNILHRDITPQNILVTQQAWVKITDFGIAKARNEISTTSPGMIRGKLGYFAPEQLAGREPDHRLDLFCAAIVLWEVLAGRRLFKGKDEADTIRMISEAKVPSLSQFRDDVSPELEMAINKGLAKNPDDRYADAQAFYNGLTQAILPETADEIADMSRVFLSQNSAAFAKLFEDEEQDAAHDTTVLPMQGARDGSTAVATISDLVAPPRGRLTALDKEQYIPTEPKGQFTPTPSHTRSSLVWVAVLSAVVALTLAGGGAYLLLRPGSERDKGPVVSGNAGMPQPLTLEEVQLGVDGERRSLSECYKGATAQLKALANLGARLVIASTGGVASAELDPPADKWGRAGLCVRDRLLAIRFRPHSAPAFSAQVTLPELGDSDSPVLDEDKGDKDKGDKDKADRDKGDKVDKRPTKDKTSKTKAVKPLSGPEINAMFRSHQRAIVKCLERIPDLSKAPAQVTTKVSITAEGVVDSVDISPPLGSASAEQCLAAAVKAMRFRAPGVRLDLKVPLVLR